jgi:hypothetical protein
LDADKFNLSDVFHKPSSESNKKIDPVSDSQTISKKRKAKHRIFNRTSFEEGREVLGEIIVEGMKTTGGTDIDWMVEHNNCFMFLEVKRFSDDKIRLPLAQMIAYRNLHSKLNQSTLCYFYIVGVDNGFMKNNEDLWIFEMTEWSRGAIIDLQKGLSEIEIDGEIKKGYYVEREFMRAMNIDELRKTMEDNWVKFDSMKSR